MRNNKRPIVFLDCDGVINSLATFLCRESRRKSTLGNHERTDPIAVGLIERLCKQTNASIVLSSAWRTTNGTQRYCLNRSRVTLANAGAGCLALRMIGVTTELPAGDYRRGREIHLWRLENGHKGPFVILDDDSDMMPEQRPWFVQTRFSTGFRLREYIHALMLLAPKHRDCALWRQL